MKITHKQFLAIVLTAGALSALSWWFVIQRLNPFSGGYLALVLFYLTFFLFAAALFTLIGYLIRLITYRREVYFIHLNIALRQGILLAVLSFFLLLFQSHRVLTWWDSLLLVAIIVLLEFYFISRGRKW